MRHHSSGGHRKNSGLPLPPIQTAADFPCRTGSRSGFFHQLARFLFPYRSRNVLEWRSLVLSVHIVATLGKIRYRAGINGKTGIKRDEGSLHNVQGSLWRLPPKLEVAQMQGGAIKKLLR
jgi:hypothetical protein